MVQVVGVNLSDPKLNFNALEDEIFFLCWHFAFVTRKFITHLKIITAFNKK